VYDMYHIMMSWEHVDIDVGLVGNQDIPYHSVRTELVVALRSVYYELEGLFVTSGVADKTVVITTRRPAPSIGF